VEGTGSHIYVVGISLGGAIGGFLFGFDSGVVNGTVHALSVAFGTQAAATGFAVASVLLGCAVGAFGAGTLANRIGAPPGHVNQRRSLPVERVRIRRRWFSRRFYRFKDCRWDGNWGGECACPHVYRGRWLPPFCGGRLASLQQLAIVLGLFCAFLSNDILAKLAGGAEASFWLGAPAWRWMYWMEAVAFGRVLSRLLADPGITALPRFLRVNTIRRAKSLRASAAMLTHWCDRSSRAYRANTAATVGLAHTWQTSASQPWCGSRWVSAAFQQFVGINIIFYYGEVLWKAAGATEQWALRINLLDGP
jgi:SP family sugar:H+ symporter-like MFS transporter